MSLSLFESRVSHLFFHELQTVDLIKALQSSLVIELGWTAVLDIAVFAILSALSFPGTLVRLGCQQNVTLFPDVSISLNL